MACKPAPEPSSKRAAGPSVRATVVTLRTALHPENRTIVSTIVIAGDRARDTSERDAWRLYDVKARTVTFVDDVEKTARTETLDALLRKRRAALSANVAAFHPRPSIARGGARRTIQNATAEQWVIEAGTYRRELWMADHPSIPRGLYAMMLASESVSSPLAPLMREVDTSLTSASGFPLADRSEIPMGTPPMIVERNVTSIAQREVPESWLTVPRGYRDTSANNEK